MASRTGNKSKKKHPAKKKPYSSTVAFLREISQEVDKEISLKEVTKQIKISEDAAQQIISFLELFDLISKFERDTDTFITSNHQSQIDMINSLIQYFDNGYKITTNWDLPSDNLVSTEILNRGINLLTKLEERRLNDYNDKTDIRSVHVNLFIIKANVRGTKLPQFLMEYNPKSYKYQFIGGYLHGESPDSKESYLRLAEKDLKLNKLDIESDFMLTPYHKTLSTETISAKRGVVTKYIINLTHVVINRNVIKLEPIQRWFTLQEIIDGVTAEGIRINSPFSDGMDEKEMGSIFNLMPLSLLKVQPEFESKVASTLNHQKNSDKISDILKNDESLTLEFKSSTRWDYNTEKMNKALEKTVVRVISSFLNTEGGTLVIGVDDKKRVVGLESDFETLAKKNRDGYEQYITAIISSYLGVELLSHINISFEFFNNKEVCILEVDESPYPVFVKEQEDREFYIRSASSTRKLNAEEVYKYIQSRWQ